MTGVNVGCGPHPLPGWVNVDNSPTLLLARLPVGRFLGPGRRSVWEAARRERIRFASATRLPFPNESVDSVYSSHMLEHLQREQARRFLHECKRILKPDGWLRVSVPSLSTLASEYLADRDADRFLARLMLGTRRGHRWMYDERSLPRLFVECGFPNPIVVPAGVTNLVFRDGLNTGERAEESLYVEAQPDHAGPI